MHGIAERRALLLCIVIGSQLATALLARSGANLWQAAGPWMLGLAAAVILVNGRVPRMPQLPELWRNVDVWIGLGLFLLAGLLRFPRLETLPAGIYGDEGEFGALALAVTKGEGPDTFGVAFLGDPALYIHILAPFVDWFGPTMEAIRLPSALIGAATVPLFFGLVRNLYGRLVATVATFLLATSAVHIHFSRLALNVVWVPFFACLSIWLLKRGLDERRHVWFLLAGFAGGIGFYFHFGARLILPILMAVLVLQIAVERKQWRRWTGAMGATLVGGFLALNPLLAYLITRPHLLTDHTSDRAIWNNWEDLAGRYDTTPSNKLWILVEQVWVTLVAFVAQPDSLFGANTYRFMHAPLLNPGVAALALVGVGILAFRARSVASRIVLVWWFVPVLFASVLTDVAGQAHRLINPLLVAFIAAGLVADVIRRSAQSRLPERSSYAFVGLILLLALVAGTRDSYRYLRPGATDEFALAGTVQARCIEGLPPDTVALIAGSPRIYARHGPSKYLGSDIDREDLTDPVAELAVSRPALILVHEKNHDLIAEIKSIYPEAPTVEVERPAGTRALTVFAVSMNGSDAATMLQSCLHNAEA